MNYKFTSKSGKNIKVLMLGWEFPPLMAGGLAIATEGLVNAISKLIPITLIIPKNQRKREIENVNIIGLNLLDKIQLSELGIDSKYINELVFDLSVYPQKSSKTRINVKEKKKDTITFKNEFLDDDIYGENIKHKIELYKNIVSTIVPYLSFEVIHAHDWVTFEAAKAVKEISGKPLVLHVHSLETDRVNEECRSDIYHIEKSAMEAADQIIPVSKFTKQKIIKNYGIANTKISPVYNGIETQYLSRWKHKITDKIVTFIGRVTSQKGPSFLLETAEKVIKQNNNIKFIIAGNGNDWEYLISETAYRKLSSHFIFTGFLSRKEINALLTSSDVYFMPSVSEPFGLSALEAAQADVPCVLSKQSGVAELLTDSCIADFWDTDLFAKHICDLIENPSKALTMSQKNKAKLKSINWDVAAGQTLSVYKKVVFQNKAKV